MRPVRYLTDIAQSDTAEEDTTKQDGANRSLIVYYDVNQTRAANWEKRKALILGSAVFVVNPNRAKHGFSVFLNS